MHNPEKLTETRQEIGFFHDGEVENDGWFIRYLNTETEIAHRMEKIERGRTLDLHC